MIDVFDIVIEPILVMLGYAPDCLSQEQIDALNSIENISIRPKRSPRKKMQVADVYLHNVLLGTAYGSRMEFYGERERLEKSAEFRDSIAQIEKRCYSQMPKPADQPDTRQARQVRYARQKYQVVK